jgi:hypothetical protein
VDDLAARLAEEPEPAVEKAVENAAETSVEAGVEATHEPDGEAAPEGAPAEAAPTEPPAQTLLVVDQFEEVFTTLELDQRIGFVEAVVGAAERGRVVIGLRSDFFTRCGEYPELSTMVTANTMLMPPMNEDELRRAIERPAAAAGLRVEAGLVDRMTAEVGDGEVGLAHLATALRAAVGRAHRRHPRPR